MDKRMAGDYEIIQSFHIGDQEVVLGENVSAPPEERYMCAYCQQNEMLQYLSVRKILRMPELTLPVWVQS